MLGHDQCKEPINEKKTGERKILHSQEIEKIGSFTDRRAHQYRFRFKSMDQCNRHSVIGISWAVSSGQLVNMFWKEMMITSTQWKHRVLLNIVSPFLLQPNVHFFHAHIFQPFIMIHGHRIKFVIRVAFQFLIVEHFSLAFRISSK